jgi:hypothetical protein
MIKYIALLITFSSIVRSHSTSLRAGHVGMIAAGPDASSVDENQDSGKRRLQGRYYTTSNLGARNIDAAMGNPLKGLMSSPRWARPPYRSDIPISLEYYYIGLDEVITGDNQFDWTAVEDLLDDSASRNQHVVPRFYIHYPGRSLRLPQFLLDTVEIRSYDTFGGGVSPYYGDPILLDALEKFISAFGAKYDGDQRIGFIQMGILGFWGEWHDMGNGLLPSSAKNDVVAWFAAAFDVTKLQTRYALQSAYDAGMGLHDDSYAYSTLDGDANGGNSDMWFFWPRVLSKGHDDFWKKAPMGGETRPEIQSTVFESGYPAGTRNHQDFNLCTEVTHATYMLHHNAFASEITGTELANARYAHAYMGYNFQVTEVSASESTAGGVDIDVTVEQIGVAPFYYSLDLVLDCDGLASPVNVGGVETLVEQNDMGLFKFNGLPATLECLGTISLSLHSPMAYAGNPIKFAQGSDGTVSLNLPLPNGQILPPTNNDPPPVSPPVSPPVNPPVAPIDITFFLMDANADSEIGPLESGETVDLSVVGNSLSIRADVTVSVNSVEFVWTDGTAQVHAEGGAPYAMTGNSGTDYFVVDYLGSTGTKEVKVTAKSSTGAILATKTITFTVVDAQGTGSGTGSGTPTDTVISFFLIDASADSEISPLTSGETVDLGLVGNALTIRADVTTSVDSVEFVWTEDNGTEKVHTETNAPYAMDGDGGSSTTDYYVVDYLASTGTKVVKVTAKSSTGAILATKSITFTVVDAQGTGSGTVPPPVDSGRIDGLTLMNANTNAAIDVLTNGDTIDLAVLGSSLTIRADTTGEVNGVGFIWVKDDGTEGTHLEGAAVWAMEGNSGTDYFASAYLGSPGTKTVTATAYDDGSGVVGELTVTFSVVDNP